MNLQILSPFYIEKQLAQERTEYEQSIKEELPDDIVETSNNGQNTG